jgi:phosphate acetyltransferase
MALPESAREYIAAQVERLRAMPRKKRIVFPEGDDKRVIEVAARLKAEGLVEPIVIEKTTDRYARLYHERRRAKGITEVEAAQAAAQRLNYAALMVAAGEADAMIGSAIYTTAEYVRAVLQSIGLRFGVRRVSSAHVMAVQARNFGHGGLMVLSDAAIMAEPEPIELAEIAIATAATARAVLGTEPLLAMLSFSTKGSAKHKEAQKVVDALRYVQARAPHLRVDGELQADAALVPSVGQAKALGSPVAGRANTLIFPDLNSANIGYKLVERLGRGALLAVLLQGTAKPASIIPRGCTVEDAYNTAIITAVQAQAALAAAT